ncbi:MAG: DNA-protecting protein DprA [Firmicutes bacterium]|nr:DNA-protecting protein DprA [Bacillota bacterium]
MSLGRAAGIGPRRFVRLVEFFGSPQAVLGRTAAEVSRAACVPLDVAAGVLRSVPGIEEDLQVQAMARAGARLVTYLSTEYPPLLRNIHDFPPFLFVRGMTLSSLGAPARGQDRTPWVAVVGSRKATPYGRSMAAALARDLSLSGVVVVSGMAAGIDSCAHRGALDGGGPTVAVLGTGVDVPYPRANAALLESIIHSGAVVSEYPMGSQPEPWRFPARNRIISGMCEATVVVEAGESSGALITADFALEQGREVLAVPGPAGAAMSRGTNGLIRSGAGLVETAADVLEPLGLETSGGGTGRGTGCGAQPSVEEGAVMEALREGPMSVGEVAQSTGMDLPGVMGSLTKLEIMGLVCRLPGGVYCRRR